MNMLRKRLAIAASVATAAVTGLSLTLLPARASSARPAAVLRPAAACSTPPDVTGITFLLNQMDTGQKIGLPEAYGLFVSAVNAVLPNPQLDPSLASISRTVNQLLAVPSPSIAKIPSYGTQYLAMLKQVAAPLASFNGPANQVVDAVVAVMKSGASSLAPAIQPFDTTIIELAELMAEAKASTC
jgi:hypothetical protein